MAPNVHSSTEPGTAALITGIISDAQELFKQQLLLFKAEVREDVDRARKAVIAIGIGVLLAFVGLIILALGAVELLKELLGDSWVRYGIVGGGLVALGAILVGVVVTRPVKSLNPLSETTAGLEENVEWKTNRK